MSVTCSDLRLTRPADEKKQKTPKNMMKLDKSFSLQNPSKELLLFNSPKNIDFRGIEREFIVNDMKQYHAMLLHFLQASTGRLLLDVDLKAFEIASNHLVSDVTVQELCRINPSLRTIRLNGCSNISDISLWAICNLASGVRGVYLADCTRITNIGLRSFSLRCTELTTIDLSNCNQLDDASMSSLFSGCWKLETINLSGCTGISDEGLINIGVCRQLKHLNLNSCSNIGNFGSRVLKTLGSFCKDLREMYFRGCKRVEDAGLMGISRGCLSLECFEASGCDLITYRGLKAIFQNLKLLKKLTLRDCCLLEDSDLQRALRAREASFPSGFGDAALRSHDSLLELDISGARLITDKGIQALANSSVSFSLLALNLASTRVSDLTSTLIADHFTKLQSLDLSTCPLISDSSIQCLAMGVTALSTLKLNGTDRVTKETLMSLVGPRLRFAELATQWVGYQPKLDYLDCIRKAELLQLHTRMTIRLQCAIRRKLALKKLKLRRHMNLLDRAIPLIQAKVRGSQQRSRFRRILGTVSRHKAALKIQSFYRKFKCEVIKTKRLQAERWLSCERRTALLAQRIYRGFVGRKDARSKRDQKANSLLIEAKLQARKELQATVIAKYVRAHLARKKTSELLAERERQRIVIMDREAKCRTLQRIARGCFGRNEANRNRNQLSIWRQRWLLGRELQRVFRGFQGRMRAKLRRKEAQLEREEFMAIRIQRVYKEHIQKMETRRRSALRMRRIREYRASILIQRMVRGYLGRVFMKRALRRKRRELAEERGAYLFQTLFRGHKGREAAEIERELKQLDFKARPLYHLIAAHTDELNRIETSLEGTDKRIACYLEEMEEAELELNSLTMSNAKYSDSARINSTPQRFVTKYLRVRLKDHILQIAEKARMEQELQRASKEKTNDLARRIRMARRELVPLTLGCISKVKQERGRRLRAYVRSRDKSVVLLQAVVRAYAARKGYRDPARNYWILCSDQTLSGIPYYYNTQTQESSWNAPFIFKFALSAVSAPCHLLTTDASYMEEEEQEEEDFSEDADSSWSGDESTILEGDESCSEDNNANYK